MDTPANRQTTSRRSFLKFGAIAAAPLAAAAPALATPADDATERLARLEDINAVRDLHAAYLRALNAGRLDDARALFADPKAAEFDPRVRVVAQDAAEPAAVSLSEDRRTATLAAACTVKTETPIEGDHTIIRMARLQGDGVIRATGARTLDAGFVKTDAGWKIANAALA